MKKALKIFILVIFLAFVALQFIRPERVNPPINEDATLKYNTKVPENVNKVFERSCNDCHSNETVYPWYSNISPISWKVVEHIEEGREELNFSVWNKYSVDKKIRKLEEICDEVNANEMPHDQYLWIHWDAQLSEYDKKLLCNWTEIEIKKLELE